MFFRYSGAFLPQCRYPGAFLPQCRYSVIPVSRYSGLSAAVSAFRYSGIPVFRHSGIPAFRYSGIPVSRYSGIPVSRHSVIPAFCLHCRILLAAKIIKMLSTTKHYHRKSSQASHRPRCCGVSARAVAVCLPSLLRCVCPRCCGVSASLLRCVCPRCCGVSASLLRLLQLLQLENRGCECLKITLYLYIYKYIYKYRNIFGVLKGVLSFGFAAHMNEVSLENCNNCNTATEVKMGS